MLQLGTRPGLPAAEFLKDTFPHYIHCGGHGLRKEPRDKKKDKGEKLDDDEHYPHPGVPNGSYDPVSYRRSLPPDEEEE